MMSEEQRAEDGVTEAGLTGPGGWGLKFRGSNELLLMLLLIACMAGAVGYVLMNHEANAKDRDTAQLQRDVNITKAIDEQSKNIEAMIYVLTLDEKQRKALNLGKPERLREMQH
jgi:hypothetical protein